MADKARNSILKSFALGAREGRTEQPLNILGAEMLVKLTRRTIHLHGNGDGAAARTSAADCDEVSCSARTRSGVESPLFKDESSSRTTTPMAQLLSMNQYGMELLGPPLT